MKEYLNPEQGYSLVRCFVGETPIPKSWIEVPKDSLVFGRNKLSGMREFYKKGKSIYIEKWSNGKWIVSDYHFGDIEDIWSRATQDKLDKIKLDNKKQLTEKCVFQGKNGDYLVDGVGELEMCEGGSKLKHSHYKKNVAHLNVIDPYRIADLYDLHPCAEHIMKKSLCAGGRGHKDLLRDIQDIIDTAERWKEMIEEDNREF